MDFTNPTKPVEIASFDRAPIDPNILVLAGSWSAYWYNGNIYSSEIARGLDVFELTPTKNLSQNEIDAAKSVQVGELNVQSQQMIVWPNKILVAKAYVDQLERVKAFSAAETAQLRSALDKPVRTKLASLAAMVQRQSRLMRNDPHMAKMQALAAILKQPGI